MTKQLWIALIDFIVTCVLYFGGKYLTPSLFEDIQFFIKAANVFVAVLLLHFYGVEARAFLSATVRSLKK